MKPITKTIEKLGDVLIRLGEAAIIGASASLFIPDFLLANSVFGFAVGLVLVGLGLYIFDNTEPKGT